MINRCSPKMGDASKQSDLPTSMEIPKEKQQPIVSSTKTMNPLWRLSPRHNGSTLYDSYELRAVTNQLNKAMQGSSGSSPTFTCHLQSPFFRQRLDRIYKENSKIPRRIMCSQASLKGTKSATRGFVAKVWKKIKQGLLRNKSRNDTINDHR